MRSASRFRYQGLLVAAVLLVAAMVWAHGMSPTSAHKPGVKVGQQVPGFTLKDINGHEHTLAQYKGKPVVLVFVSNRCPWSRGTDPTLSKIAANYKSKGVVLLGIDADKRNSPHEIKQYAAKHDVTYTILKDAGNHYADELGARQTPEVFVVNAQGKLIYHGAVDDRTSPKQAGKKNYVRDALNATLAGKPVAIPEKHAFGCGIDRVSR